MNKLCEIATIGTVAHHPNADRLDVVTINGYEAIVARDQYSVGDVVLFVYPDACLPRPDTHSWTEPYFKYVSPSTGRVKAKQLRNVWSFGIVVPLDPSVPRDLDCEQLAEHLGIHKYEPPLPTNVDVKGPLPWGLSKTDEDRVQNYLYELDLNEIVPADWCLTEKVDGSSITVYCYYDPAENRWHSGYCMRNWELKRPVHGTTNEYWDALNRGKVLEQLEAYCMSTKQSLAFRGEVYGAGTQRSKQNFWSKCPNRRVFWYNVYDMHARRYLSFDQVFEMFSKYSLNNLDIVNEFVIDPSRDPQPLTIGRLIDLISDAKTIGDLLKAGLQHAIRIRPVFVNNEQEAEWLNSAFEGIVVKKPNGSSFKIINKVYDSGKD